MITSIYSAWQKTSLSPNISSLPLKLIQWMTHSYNKETDAGLNATECTGENIGWSSDCKCFPFNNFMCLSSFDHSTCALSVSGQYLALDEIYHPFWAAFPNNSTYSAWQKTSPSPNTSSLPLKLIQRIFVYYLMKYRTPRSQSALSNLYLNPYPIPSFLYSPGTLNIALGL